ncbi:MAG: septum formation initiator family protein [Clostridiales bacterium]|jgi:cell division protein FtsB|nr:septum formation initiator family protein [Clostridiales bacterium]
MRHKPKKKLRPWIHICLWAMILTASLTAILIQTHLKRNQTNKIGELTRQLEAAESTRMELQRKLDYNKSEQYAEEYAHDELGLVYSDEIIIYDDGFIK